MTKKWTKVYSGFESLHGFDEDLLWALQYEDVLPDGDFEGDLIITMEYQEEGMAKNDELKTKLEEMYLLMEGGDLSEAFTLLHNILDKKD